MGAGICLKSLNALFAILIIFSKSLFEPDFIVPIKFPSTGDRLSILSPELFNESKVFRAELWDDFLKPAAAKGLVSGELYEGAFENLNTIEDVERLDASLGEE